MSKIGRIALALTGTLGLWLGTAAPSSAAAAVQKITQVTTEGPFSVDSCFGPATFTATVTDYIHITETPNPDAFVVAYRTIVDYTVVPEDDSAPVVTGQEVDQGAFIATASGTTVFSSLTHDRSNTGWVHDFQITVTDPAGNTYVSLDNFRVGPNGAC